MCKNPGAEYLKLGPLSVPVFHVCYCRYHWYNCLPIIATGRQHAPELIEESLGVPGGTLDPPLCLRELMKWLMTTFDDFRYIF
jgi:hypothetical protein